MEKCYSPVDGDVSDTLLKMCHSPMGINVSSQLCGKDTFTGVTKKYYGLSTFINVS